MSRPLTRRRALGLAAAGLAVATTSACERLGGASDATTAVSPTSIPGTAAGAIESALAPGGRADWVLQAPASGSPKALVVSLHGKNGNALDSFEMGFGTSAVRVGLAIVSVSGGSGYWHARDDGTDSGRLVLDEVIPMALERAGLHADAKLGFIGWSMGGYGSLLLASQLPPDRVIGVAPMSTALWTEPGATAPGAFDDAADYHAHDVFARERLLPGTPVYLACGLQDPFVEANRAYVRGRPQTRRTFDKGRHDVDYWRAHSRRLIPWLGSLA